MNLDRIFKAESVAIVGASLDETSVGFGLLKNMVEGCTFMSEFCMPNKGKIYPVNPKYTEMMKHQCYPSITAIPDQIDLVIIAVPAKIVPAICMECAKKKVGGVVIISAGFSEMGAEGIAMQEEVVSTLSKAKIPMVGPNCLGVIVPKIRLNASFAFSVPPCGSVAFISQSGALADSVIDWAIDEPYGFSGIVSYGNAAMLDVTDYLEYFEKDPDTKVITLYIEGIKDGKRFIETAKRITQTKPIIVIKAGKTGQGAQAIASHTGSLAGSYEVYKAAFRQSGAVEAESVEQMFDIAKALSWQPVPAANSFAIITNGGGCGVLCADACYEHGVGLAVLNQSTIQKLDATKVMNPTYSKRNPLDLIGNARPESYAAAINTLLAEDYISGLIIIQTLQTTTDPKQNAQIIADANKKYPDKPILCAFVGGRFTRESMKILESSGIPNYSDVHKAAEAAKALVDKGNVRK